MKAVLFAATILAGSVATAGAQGADHSTMGHGAGHSAPAATGEGGARAAFEAANMRMHADMDVELTGDADVDFARSMIPHHQGAVDMAEIALEHGQDPELRALAEEIIETQEREIAILETWLEENAPEAGSNPQ